MGHISEARTSLAPPGAGAFIAQFAQACVGSQTDQFPPSILLRLIKLSAGGYPAGPRHVRAHQEISTPRLLFASEHSQTPDITEMPDLPALL